MCNLSLYESVKLKGLLTVMEVVDEKGNGMCEEFSRESAGHVPQVSSSYFLDMKPITELPHYGFDLSTYRNKEFDPFGIPVINHVLSQVCL